MSRFRIECRAPINIAILKYWGKRDEELVLPLHSSLSLTLHSDAMCSHIVVQAESKQVQTMQMTLNNAVVDMESNKRLQAVLKMCREFSNDIEIRVTAEDSSEKSIVYTPKELLQLSLSLECDNNFPTAAGLASSASGYACLTHALCNIFGVQNDLALRSTIARMGSGSACRSMAGGFVAWTEGERQDGKDSHAVQVADELHWPEMRVLILITNASQKGVSSTIGMQRSVETSDLLHFRAKSVVDERMKAMSKSIEEYDFETFGELTMKDSNQFHATCLDTYPPIFYLNETSKRIIDDVHAFNASMGSIKAAYTFDAGPNACLFTLEKDLPALLSLLVKNYHPSSIPMDKFVYDPMHLSGPLEHDSELSTSGVSRIILTKVGPGPQTLSDLQTN